jgi:hypothetical protein
MQACFLLETAPVILPLNRFERLSGLSYYIMSYEREIEENGYYSEESQIVQRVQLETKNFPFKNFNKLLK